MAWGQAITQGLGRTGNELYEAKQLGLDEQQRKLQLLTQQMALRELQQRMGLQPQQFQLEQQREQRLAHEAGIREQQMLRPRHDFFQVGNNIIDIQQNADGTTKMQQYPVGAGDTGTAAYVQQLMSSIKDPVKRQRVGDVFAAHAAMGDTKGGLAAAQQELGRMETEESAEGREDKREAAAQARQARTEAAMEERQNRLFAHQEEMVNKRQAGKANDVIQKSEQGLKVLQASLFGGGGIPGLDSTMDVLDNKMSRLKLIGAGVGKSPGTNEWMTTRLFHAGAFQSMNKEEREYGRQFARAVSAIQGLRTITGLPRSTQQLMQQYIMELPDPVTTQSAADGHAKLQLVEREIRAALSKESLADALGQEEAQPVNNDPLGIFK